MADIVDKATRSRMMAGIRGRDTRPELELRRALHALGFRFRLQSKDLPGRPDILLPGRRAAIFVHGCFWHRHRGCRFSTTPATRREFWNEKFAANLARDERNTAALRALGWRVAIVWECALRAADRAESANAVAQWLRSSEAELEIGAAQV